MTRAFAAASPSSSLAPANIEAATQGLPTLNSKSYSAAYAIPTCTRRGTNGRPGRRSIRACRATRSSGVDESGGQRLEFQGGRLGCRRLHGRFVWLVPELQRKPRAVLRRGENGVHVQLTRPAQDGADDVRRLFGKDRRKREICASRPEEARSGGDGTAVCTGITLYSPLKHWKAGPGKKVGIVGLGGLGHMGVKLSHALGAKTVLFTTSPSKWRTASVSGPTKW